MKDSRDSSQVYGIYKLKTKAMHEKLERIKDAFDEQQQQVKDLKSLFESNIETLSEQINELRLVKSPDRMDFEMVNEYTQRDHGMGEAQSQMV